MSIEKVMKGPSHPGSSTPGGFRKTAYSGQYKFKVASIRGIFQSHLYMPVFLLPAGGAMTITGFCHVDFFSPALLSSI